MFEGIKRIGASRYAIISMIGSVITLLAAYLIFLNEKLDRNQFTGAFITMSGIFMLQGSGFLNKIGKYLPRRP
jgi:drug/metabolite transporter (DMT)-like permease